MSNPPRPAKIYRSTCRKFAACVTAFTLVALCLFAPAQPSVRAQNAGTPSTLVISQIYTHGGEPGASLAQHTEAIPGSRRLVAVYRGVSASGEPIVASALSR